MKIGMIGVGAIGTYVRDKLLDRGHELRAVMLRPERLQDHQAQLGDTVYVASVADLPDDVEHMIDCAGVSSFYLGKKGLAYVSNIYL